MAGHSKWANIKHKKGRQDAKKAKLFTKFGREIMVSVRLGGADTALNPRLKLALQKARAANMPNDNINRIIQKALGDDGGANYEELTYEGYGLGGAAVMVDVLTDNRNRAAGDVRHAFDKYGGNLGETGCVGWMFETRGQILVDAHPDQADELTLIAIEAGADDMDYDDGTLTIYTAQGDLEAVREGLETAGVTVSSAEIARIPQNTVLIDDLETAQKLVKMMDALEDNDDVQDTWSNFDFTDEISEKLS